MYYANPPAETEKAADYTSHTHPLETDKAANYATRTHPLLCDIIFEKAKNDFRRAFMGLKVE